MRVSDFDYDLPDEAIAQEAVEPRHSSRLLDTRDMTDHRFLDLPGLLEPGDLIVVNETRVRAARLVGRRAETGGKVELLLLDRSADGRWRALAKPARRLRPGVIVEFEGMSATVVEPPDEGVVRVTLNATDEEAAIRAAGSVPLPPYFKGELEDTSRYQTIYAEAAGSAAAPTAGLHFTEEVLAALEVRGVRIASVDLHVSLDTFRPMDVDNVQDHKMHSEWCSVPDETKNAIDETREMRGKVVAIGTTVVRTLESFADGKGGVTAGSKETTLFLQPGYTLRVVDGLVTNFHLPRSTLLVLLAALMGPGWRDVYETALARGYRFLSFGDAMYAERTRD